MLPGAELLVEPATLILTACAVGTIVMGCHLSTSAPLVRLSARAVEAAAGAEGVKPITALAAVTLPLLGSVVLVLLFFFLNIVYYLLVGVMAFGAFFSLLFVFEPVTDRLVRALSSRFPGLASRPLLSSAAVSALPALGIVVWWIVTMAWPLSDLLAVCMGVSCIAAARMPSMRVATFLLGAFLAYDVFWVFLSSAIFGRSVMESVAFGLLADADSALPALVTFPRIATEGASILGMGDIVLPGLFLCYLHRVDFVRQHQQGGKVPKYFLASMAMYVAGLFVTFCMLVILKRGQPALLYLVPAVFTAPLFISIQSREFLALWRGQLGTSPPAALPIASAAAAPASSQ